MSASMDELSPDYMGEDRLVLLPQLRLVPAGALNPDGTINKNIKTIDIYRAHQNHYWKVVYTQCDPEGVVLPLEMIVRGPSQSSYKRKVYSTHAPNVLHYKPTEGGVHLIMLREVAHNRWWGRINVNVTGPSLNRPRFG